MMEAFCVLRDLKKKVTWALRGPDSLAKPLEREVGEAESTQKIPPLYSERKTEAK